MAKSQITIMEENTSAPSLFKRHTPIGRFFTCLGAGSPAELELTERALDEARVPIVDDEPASHTITPNILHREAMASEQAVAILEQGVRNHHWDAETVDVLKSLLKEELEQDIHADQDH